MQHEGQLPLISDAAIQQFLSKWGLLNAPVYIQYSNHGYEPAWCHVSAKHKAMTDGGRRVHGWALWTFGADLVADHHSVWENHDGELVDVTEPSNGGAKILFVRDDSAKIEVSGGAVQLFTQRTADPNIHWLWQRKPSEYSNWNCPDDKADLVEYSAKLNIPVSAIVTDSIHG